MDSGSMSSVGISATETPPPGYMSEDGDPMDQNDNLSEFKVWSNDLFFDPRNFHKIRVDAQHLLVFRFFPFVGLTVARSGAGHVPRSNVLVLNQLLRVKPTRRRNLPCFAAIHHRRWLHRPIQFRALLSRSAVKREPQWSRGANETTHRQRRPIVLHRRWSVRRMSQRLEHLRTESELQFALRMAPGDRLQNSTRMQPKDF